jgi:hypothetical protein
MIKLTPNWNLNTLRFDSDMPSYPEIIELEQLDVDEWETPAQFPQHKNACFVRNVGFTQNMTGAELDRCCMYSTAPSGMAVEIVQKPW